MFVVGRRRRRVMSDLSKAMLLLLPTLGLSLGAPAAAPAGVSLLSFSVTESSAAHPITAMAFDVTAVKGACAKVHCVERTQKSLFDCGCVCVFVVPFSWPASAAAADPRWGRVQVLLPARTGCSSLRQRDCHFPDTTLFIPIETPTRQVQGGAIK